MMRFVHLRFDGLLSFGSPAVGEVRPTDIFPACSMITGLLANALGYEHTERARMQKLQSAISMGTRVDLQGSRIIDFQTLFSEKEIPLWRSDSLQGKKDTTYKGTSIRRKSYLSDSIIHTIIGIAPREDEEIPSIDDIARALIHPFRVLFIGRYCCIPYSPLYRGVIEADSVHSALERIASKKSDGLFLAEWPVATDSHEKKGEIMIERQDLRDWINDIHAGSRLVWRGTVQGVEA